MRSLKNLIMVVVGIGCGACGGQKVEVEGASSDLSGTWSAAGTDLDGDSRLIVISLSKDQLKIDDESGSLSANRAGNEFRGMLTRVSQRPHALRATQVGGGLLNTGVLPLDPTGTWTVTNDPPDDDYGCSLTFTQDQLTASCKRASRLIWMPHLSGRTVSGNRTKRLSSIFGDLGGEWVIRSGESNCTFRLEGQSLTSSCSGDGRMQGTAEITFNGDRCSGRTSAGIEFAAERR